MSLLSKINNIDFESDKSIIKFIRSLDEQDKGMFTGTNEDNETIVVTIGTNGFKVVTYQNNNWIRINEYLLTKDEYSKDELVRSELYER